MDYARLGATGLEVSRICLGCMSYGDPDRGNHEWSLDEDEARPFIRRALEAGINFFDTANAYSAGSSEEIVGRALPTSASRDEVVLATKVHMPQRPGPNGGGLRRKAIMQRDRREPAPARHRLRRPLPDPPLGHHTPDRGDARGAARRGEGRARPATSAPRRCTRGSSARRSTPPTRTAGPGSSACRTTTTCCSREEEREMLPLCADQGVGVIPWSPLARGRLTRDLDATTARSETDAFGRTLYSRRRRADHRCGARHRRSPRRLAGAGGAGLGARQARHHRADHRGHQDATISRTPSPRWTFDLTPDEIAALEKPYTPRPVAGF